MTPREFSNAVRGYNEELEQRTRETWEQARLMAYYAVALHVKKGKNMYSMIPLPWDHERQDEDNKPSKEEVQRFMYRLNKTVPGWQDRPLVVS